MWLWNCFEEVGLKGRFIENIKIKLAIVSKMLEKGNINIALMCYHNYSSDYYRHLASSFFF